MMDDRAQAVATIGALSVIGLVGLVLLIVFAEFYGRVGATTLGSSGNQAFTSVGDWYSIGAVVFPVLILVALACLVGSIVLRAR